MTAVDWQLTLLVFGCVFALAWGVLAYVGGGAERRQRTRLLELRDIEEGGEAVSLIRAQYLKQLSPLERALEQLPGMATLARLSEQAGRTAPAYRLAFECVILGALAAVVALVLSRNVPATIAAAVVVAVLPLAKLIYDRNRRLQLFEQQLPDALDLMGRSLRAGSPLLQSLKFVAQEMKPPVAEDFEITWSHVNYGVSLKAALLDMVERTPSLSLRALVTAILVQRETGGNLAEILDKISGVLRARARFERKVRTLTAEGRISAWVLAIVPFALAGGLAITSPTYLPMLFEDPAGRRLIIGAILLGAVGIFWISRVIRVRV